MNLLQTLEFRDVIVHVVVRDLNLLSLEKKTIPASRSFTIASELSISNDIASALPDFNRFRKTESRLFIAFFNSFCRAADSLGWYLVLNL